jgi:hypothetical protein
LFIADTSIIQLGCGNGSAVLCLPCAFLSRVPVVVIVSRFFGDTIKSSHPFPGIFTNFTRIHTQRPQNLYNLRHEGIWQKKGGLFSCEMKWFHARMGEATWQTYTKEQIFS